MRRNAKIQSRRSRRGGGEEGSSPSVGRLRLALLLATAAAFLLVPAAQAFGVEATVDIESPNEGGGKVTSETGFGSPGDGTPPINCILPEGLPEGSPPEGVCKNVVDEFGPGEWGIYLEPIADPNSNFVEWEIASGFGFSSCELNEEVCIVGSAGEPIEATAVFACEEPGACEEPPPPGLKLTLNIEEGEGTVASNPAAAGFPCSGLAVTTCEAEFEEGSPVTLTASPAPGYLFKSWKKCDTGGVNGRQCTVTMSSAKEVGAKFVKSWDLDATKTGAGIMSTSPGGILCGYNCLAASAAFKDKTAITVKTKPAKHFQFVEFTAGTGSASVCTGLETPTCTFTIEADSAVEEVYAEDDKNTLSLAKEGGGQGFVKTKPSGVLCGYTCSSASAEYFFNEVVTVSVKLNKGTSSVEWTTGAGTCTGKVETLESTCTVPMGENESLVAKFE